MAVSLETTVLVAAAAESPASPFDLTDLATVHDELNIPTAVTTDDAFLSRAITAASQAIRRYCNRTFQLECLQDQFYIEQDPYPYQVPGGVYPLQLSRWPLANEGAAAVGLTGNITIASPVVTGMASTEGVDEGALIFAFDLAGTQYLPAGTQVQSVSPTSLVLTQSATASVAGVSLSSGIQVIQELAVGTLQSLVFGQDFTSNAQNGWLIRLNAFTGLSMRWEAVPTTVQYSGGYDEIPDDLADACVRLVTQRWGNRGRNPSLVQRDQPGALGSERYWVGPFPGQTGLFPPEVLALIEPYRVPIAGS